MPLEYPLRTPEGFQTSADFPNLTEDLVARGYAEPDIQRIMGAISCGSSARSGRRQMNWGCG